MKRSRPMSAAAALKNRALFAPVRDFVCARGKRLRGALVQLSYSIAGGRGALPVQIAQAIEWLHAGSLVIDDIQDGSSLRRERPTMHRQIGVPLAINAGNYMYFRALELAGESPLSTEARLQVTLEMVSAARKCHEGQAIDLAAQIDQLAPADWYDVAQAISVQKTGILVELAMRMGAVAAATNQSFCDELGRFGRHVGVALQMRNDLDELVEAANEIPSVVEPVRFDDLRNRRMTWPWAWLSEFASEQSCAELSKRLTDAALQKDHTELRRIASELLQQTQEHGEKEVGRQLEKTVRILGEHVLDAAALASLRDCLRPIEYGARKAGQFDTNAAGAKL